MQQSGFGKTYSRSHVSRQPKVGILINRARDQAVDLLLAKDEGESAGKCGRCLRGSKGHFRYRVFFPEAKNFLGLVASHFLLYPNHVLVKRGVHVFEVGEDEGLREVESTSNDVFGVGVGQFYRVFQADVFPDGFLVVRQLDDEGNLEHVLEPFAEGEGNEVTQMHRIRTWTSTCVQVKGFSLLVHVQDCVHVAMGEENSSTQEMVGFLSCDFFEALQEFIVDS